MASNNLRLLTAVILATGVLASCAGANSSSLMDGASPAAVSAADTYVKSATLTLADSLKTMDAAQQARDTSFDDIKKDIVKAAGQYQTIVADVRAQLQVGTTPGNPVLLSRLSNAEDALSNLSAKTNILRDFDSELSRDISQAHYLAQMVQNALALQGASQSDHDTLQTMGLEVNRVGQHLTGLQSDVRALAEYQLAQNSSLHNDLARLASTVRNGQLTVAAAQGAPSMAVSIGADPVPLPRVDDSTPAPAPIFHHSKIDLPVPKAVNASPSALESLAKKDKILDMPAAGDVDALFSAVSHAVAADRNATFTLAAFTPLGKTHNQTQAYNKEAKGRVVKALKALQEIGVPVSRVAVEFHVNPLAKGVSMSLYQN